MEGPHRPHHEDQNTLHDRDSDVVAVLGGEGSLLAAARRMADNQRPTLGINRGRLGCLTAFENEQAEEGLARLLAGDLIEETRMMFRCHVERGSLPEGGVITSNMPSSGNVLGLNDVVVSRAGLARFLPRRLGGIHCVRVARVRRPELAAHGPIEHVSKSVLLRVPL